MRIIFPFSNCNGQKRTEGILHVLDDLKNDTWLRTTRGAHNPNLQPPLVQKLDSAIHPINHYPTDQYWGNQLCYMYWIVVYPVDRVIHLLNNWFLLCMHCMYVLTNFIWSFTYKEWMECIECHLITGIWTFYHL